VPIFKESLPGSPIIRGMSSSLLNIIDRTDQRRQKLLRWADVFPYVNGGLFAGSSGCPRFGRIAGFIPIRN
jgi:hypothetical protein